jgi:hypothetical protein
MCNSAQFRAGFDAVRPYSRYLRAEMIKHENPNGRGQICIRPPNVDAGNKVRERPLVFSRGFLQAVPEIILETDAGFAPCDYDRPFDECGSHSGLLFWKCASIKRLAEHRCPFRMN